MCSNNNQKVSLLFSPVFDLKKNKFGIRHLLCYLFDLKNPYFYFFSTVENNKILIKL